MQAAVAGTRSAGPRFFHFVMGGGTPAALGADWLASALDQIAFNWVSSPFAMRLEQISVGWLKELFGLPSAWSGVLTTGATVANFTGLAAARRWWGEQHGVDVEEQGLPGLDARSRAGGRLQRKPAGAGRCGGRLPNRLEKNGVRPVSWSPIG